MRADVYSAWVRFTRSDFIQRRPVLSNPLCIQLIPGYKYPPRLRKYLHNPIYADVELAGVEGPRAPFVRRFSSSILFPLSFHLYLFLSFSFCLCPRPNSLPEPLFLLCLWGNLAPRDFAYEASHLASDAAGSAGNPVNISG